MQQQVTQVTENIVTRAAVQLVRHYDSDAADGELAVDWKILCEAVRGLLPAAAPFGALANPVGAPEVVAAAPVPAVEFTGENPAPTVGNKLPAEQTPAAETSEWVRLSDVGRERGWTEFRMQRARVLFQRAGDTPEQCRIRSRRGAGDRGAIWMVHREDVERLAEIVQPPSRQKTVFEISASAVPPPPPETPTRKSPAPEEMRQPPAIHVPPETSPGQPLRSQIEHGRREGFKYSQIDVPAGAAKWANAARQAMHAGERSQEIKLSLSPEDCEEYAGLVKTVLGPGYRVKLTPQGQYHRIRVTPV